MAIGYIRIQFLLIVLFMKFIKNDQIVFFFFLFFTSVTFVKNTYTDIHLNFSVTKEIIIIIILSE